MRQYTRGHHVCQSASDTSSNHDAFVIHVAITCVNQGRPYVVFDYRGLHVGREEPGVHFIGELLSFVLDDHWWNLHGQHPRQTDALLDVSFRLV